MEKLEIPEFDTKKELFSFLKENKSTLYAQKKQIIKRADGFGFAPIGGADKAMVGKAGAESNTLLVKAIINTTNWMDSHKDVHIDGLWDKSLSENKMILHVQEHQSHSFDKIIASGADLKAYTKTYSWKELGYDFDGSTQALEFESNVRKSRNAYMFDQYKSGYVNNHSVGMQYMKLAMAINSDDYPEEKEVWEKYIDRIANKDQAEQTGYFWAVREAKAIEGSAVPLGSNVITPTLSVGKDFEPSDDTQKAAAAKALRNKQFFINLNS